MCKYQHWARAALQANCIVVVFGRQFRCSTYGLLHILLSTVVVLHVFMSTSFFFLSFLLSHIESFVDVNCSSESFLLGA